MVPDRYMSTPPYIRHDFRILIISTADLGLPHERSASAQAMKENCVQCRAKKADSRAMSFHGFSAMDLPEVKSIEIVKSPMDEDG